MLENNGPMLTGYGLINQKQWYTEVIAYDPTGNTFVGDDNTTFFRTLGNADVTAFFGDGFNVAKGGGGNDTFIGGDGFNVFSGGRGNDMLVGGEGVNILSGGKGDDTIVFSGDDVISGGSGFDTFILVQAPTYEEGVWERPQQYVTINDFYSWEDRLDLSVAGITSNNIEVVDNTLICYGELQTTYIEGIGYEIELVGGISNAIEQGILQLSDFYFGKG